MDVLRCASISTLADVLEIPNITIKNRSFVNSLPVIDCKYVLESIPACPICSQTVMCSRRGWGSRKRSVYDIFGDEIYLLKIRQPRFLCTHCPKYFLQSPSFVDRGVMTTKRLEQRICDEFLYNGLESAVELCHGYISEPQIRAIVSRRVKLQALRNRQATPAPKRVGIGRYKCDEGTITVVSDLDKETVIDVFLDDSDLQKYLEELIHKGIETCLCDVDSSCVDLVRHTIGSTNMGSIHVSFSSLWREASEAHIAYLNNHYHGRHKNQLRAFYSEPITNAYEPDYQLDVENWIMSYDTFSMQIKYLMYSGFIYIRRCLKDTWLLNNLNHYTKVVEALDEFKPFVGMVTFAENAISRPQPLDLQRKLIVIESNVEGIIRANRRRSGKPIRSRILLAFCRDEEKLLQNEE